MQVYYWRLLTCNAEGRTPEPAAGSGYGSEAYPESEVEFHSDSDDGNDALRMEELETEVAQ